MTYAVEIDRRAAKAIASLSREVRSRVLHALDDLARDPFVARNVKPLIGGGYRLRTGDYRIVFDVDNERVIIVVIDVAHRREVYRRKR